MLDNQQLSDQSILVLPFIDHSLNAKDRHLSDGITEEIINALSKVPKLKVLARTTSFSFKDKAIDLKEIHSNLNTFAVLEGSILIEGHRIRINAHLVKSKDSTLIWSEKFDREISNIFSLQDEISLKIADQIRENFGHFQIQEPLFPDRGNSFEAYDLFLKARFQQLQWTEKSIEKAIAYYQESIQVDPEFTRSYCGMIQCYSLLGAWGFGPKKECYQLAHEYFLIVKDLDTGLTDYQTSMITKVFWLEWNFPLTHQLLSNLLNSQPRNSDALEEMAELLIANGYFDEAKKHIQLALEQDPLSANHHYTMANILYYKKDYKQAIYWIEKALQISADFQIAKELQLQCMIWLQDEEGLKSRIENSHAPKLVQLLYDAIHDANFELDQVDYLEILHSIEIHHYLAPYELFILANSKGKEEKALEVFQTYLKEKKGQIVNFRFEPFLAALLPQKQLEAYFPERLRIEDVQEPQRKPVLAAEKISNEERIAYASSIETLLYKDKIYLDPKINLRKLAIKMEIHPNKLSLFINQEYQKNFNEFVNTYRLEHFKELAKNPDYKHLTILGMAYESGFNSKSVFNAFFRKQIGISPKKWISNQ